MHVSFLHFHFSADRGKPARISRGDLWPASQWCTSKSPQDSAPLPCSKWGELRVGVEAILQSASIQVQAVKVVLFCWRTSGMPVSRGRSGKCCLPFPLQAPHFGYNSCSGQSPCTQVPAAQNGEARAHQLGSDSNSACGSALQPSNSGCDGGSNSRIL